jgi:predicted chitinase
MADITGSFGDQPIELNNAATEATLRELVAAIGILSVKVGGKAKGTQDIEKELKKFQQAVKKQTDVTKDLTEAEKKKLEQDKAAIKKAEEKKKAEEAAIKATHTVAKGIHNLGQVTSRVVLGMTNLLGSLSNVGNSMTSAASSMNAIPIVGGVLAGVFGAVAEASEKMLKAYQTAATVGVTFGGSMNAMVNAASGAGLTFDQFAGIVAKNSEAMMLLGGTTEAGAKRFADLGKQIRNSGVGNELLRMGYSTEQVNSGMAGYLNIMGKTGALQNMTTKQIAASSAGYLKDLDALAKITGTTREEKQKEQEQLARDAQFLAATQHMDAEAQKQMMNYITSFPKEQQAAMKDMITTGNITSEESIKLQAMLPGAAQQAMAFGRTLQAGGKISRDELNTALNLASKEAEVRSKEMKDQGLYNAEMRDAYAGTVLLSRLGQDRLKKAYDEQAKTAEKANQAEEMEKFKQKLAETSNVFTQILATSGLLKHLEDAFDLLVGITLDYVVPGFMFLADNFETLITIAGALGFSYLALKGIIIGQKIVTGALTALAWYRVKAEGGAIAAMIAKTAVVWASIAPFVIIGAKILLVVAAVGLLYLGFKKLGTDTKVIADGLKYMWSGFKTFMSYLKLGFYKLLDSLPGINYGKEIEETQQEISDQQLEREKLADSMAQRMAENRKKQEDEANEAARKKREEEEKASKVSALDRARERIAAREAANADKKKTEEAKKAADADKEKAAAAAGIPTDVGTGDPLKDLALYGRQRAEAAASAAGTATGSPTATSTVTGTPANLNQDQKKNMELITAALKKQGLNDPKYIAATLGNVMKETGGKSISENMNYSGTSNDRIRKIFGSRAAGKSEAELDSIKKDPSKMGEMMYGSGTKLGQQMGNTEPGDGFKYRGRGFIQLTGKNNYAAASKAIYGDDRLVKNPDLVNDPAVAAEVSAWYMKKGQTRMAQKLGINTGNMSQADANLLATSQIAGGDIRRKGAIGREISDKVDKFAAGFTTGPGGQMVTQTAAARQTPPVSVTPTAAAATSAGTRMVMVGNKSYVEGSPEHKAALEAANKSSTAVAQASGKPATMSQDSAESLLERLNMQVAELVAVTRDSKRVNERQLGVMADNSMNVFSMGA